MGWHRILSNIDFCFRRWVGREYWKCAPWHLFCWVLQAFKWQCHMEFTHSPKLLLTRQHMLLMTAPMLMSLLLFLERRYISFNNNFFFFFNLVSFLSFSTIKASTYDGNKFLYYIFWKMECPVDTYHPNLF